MNRSIIIGVMGGGSASDAHLKKAYRLGELIAAKGWILLNGGRNAGIMAASAQGASDNGGLTVGILPDTDKSMAARHIRIPICTGMGSARNVINVLSSDIVVACAGGAGTLSEIALALKNGKNVITLDFDPGQGFMDLQCNGSLSMAGTPEEVIEIIEKQLADQGLCALKNP